MAKKPVATFTLSIALHDDREEGREHPKIPTGVALEKMVRDTLYDNTGFLDDEIRVEANRTDK